MVSCCSRLAIAAACLAAPLAGRAQMLDELLPGGVPGFAQAAGMLNVRRLAAPSPTGFELGGVQVAPGLGLQTGYDSAPNAAAGSALLNAAPRLLVKDVPAGFGAFAQVSETAYPGNAAQNLFSAALAGGWRIQLPEETLTVSAGYLRGDETDFSLNGLSAAKPVAFSVNSLRARDEITAGRLTLTPDVSVDVYRFPAWAGEDRQDYRAGLTLRYDTDGPVSAVMALRGGHTSSLDAAERAETYAILAGLQDVADGLWTVSLLAGGAWRAPRTGPGLSAPVVEARLDWAPSRLDEIHLNITREIDDPDRLSTTPYTLTQAKLSYQRAGLGQLTADGMAEISRAAYMWSPLRETLFSTSFALSWRMSPALALQGRYVFNDRQANFLRAANEHVLTLGLDWAP